MSKKIFGLVGFTAVGFMTLAACDVNESLDTDDVAGVCTLDSKDKTPMALVLTEQAATTQQFGIQNQGAVLMSGGTPSIVAVEVVVAGGPANGGLAGLAQGADTVTFTRPTQIAGGRAVYGTASGSLGNSAKYNVFIRATYNNVEYYAAGGTMKVTQAAFANGQLQFVADLENINLVNDAGETCPNAITISKLSLNPTAGGAPAGTPQQRPGIQIVVPKCQINPVTKQKTCNGQ